MSSLSTIPGLSSHKHIVRMGDMKTTDQPDDELVTYSLGLCLAVTLYDPEAKVGGLLHALLPNSSVDPQKAVRMPTLFIDTALPLFLQEVYALGAEKSRLEIKVAGGADLITFNSHFNVGQRNYEALLKFLKKEDFKVTAESIGGHVSRTMRLDLRDGKATVEILGQGSVLL